jgi:hypothetical protein
MTGLLSPFLYSLPPFSFFLDLVAMVALRRRMQVLRKIWSDKPLPPPLMIGFLSRFLLSVSDSFTPPNFASWALCGVSWNEEVYISITSKPQPPPMCVMEGPAFDHLPAPLLNPSSLAALQISSPCSWPAAWHGPLGNGAIWYWKEPCLEMLPLLLLPKSLRLCLLIWPLVLPSSVLLLPPLFPLVLLPSLQPIQLSLPPLLLARQRFCFECRCCR